MGEAFQKEFGSPARPVARSTLDQASRYKYIYVYHTMIDLGLENEFSLGHGGPNLAPFLQNAGRESLQECNVSKRQHVLAAHALLRLAERCSTDAGDAENASNNDSLVGPVRGISDNRPLDLLEGKLVVLQFQIWIKEELEVASKLDNLNIDTSLANTVREKVRGVSLVLKSITQLYNEYAIPFELWEIRLEMLYFVDYSSDYSDAIIQFRGCLNLTVNLLKSGSDSTCEAAAGLLQEISSINLYKESVAESGAIEEITGLLSHSSLTSEVKEQSICSLWNLSVDEKLRMKIANTDLLPLAIKSLEDEDIKVKEEAGRVLVNLTLSKSLHSIMVEVGVIPKLAKLLRIDEGLVIVPMIGAAAYKALTPSSYSWLFLPDGTKIEQSSKAPSHKINAVVGRTQQQFLARIEVIEVEDERKSQSVSTSQRFTLLPWMDGVAWLVLILGLEDKLSIISDKRCKISESYAKKMVEVMKELELPRQNSKVFAGNHGFIISRDLFRWADHFKTSRNSYEDLVRDDYCLLTERLRDEGEKKVVLIVLEKHLRVKLVRDNFYYQKLSAGNNVFNKSMRRLYFLVELCYRLREPILLIGETSDGKTTICQLLSAVLGLKLHIFELPPVHRNI
ncbi:hypothetical protein VitviT2T_013980 [Vitis vinifera]|uniref:Midasin AAA lid domain-containing protein n=1 Tax=Vitis vinifera TaxID=29760 RepID=A0ABY9CJ72_VITVI|nr:hypothetical protein VitviT2T_013980 [Vitis vinifera]